MTEKILINSGPSERGFHRLEAFMRCPRLFAWGYGQGPKFGAHRFPPTPPLVRGSIGHVGLAHLYARLKAAQEGTDPDRFYKPIEAMEKCAETFGDLGRELVGPVTQLVAAYVGRYAIDKPKVVGVEEQRETEFFGYRYTARVDLETEARDGKVYFTDHKIVGRIETKSVLRYALSGQFLGLQWLGHRAYGDRFGGVVVNLLGMNGPSFHRQAIDPAPWALERFPETVRKIEEGIASGDDTPRPSEFLCWTPYGPCPAFSLCRYGG